ncbi:MAG: DegT/DnrJ/EryC1/StrS family aminotransferase [Elusimicrobia bacterium]|nr:DegT/DnrJ/EryC1/StrS family aminotransferase [Elusimicrobiota bacterium]
MRFTIGFDPRDKKALFRYWDEILTTQKWVEGKFTRLFEEKWEAHNGLPSLAFSSWSGAAVAALEYLGVRGKTVLCPSNTFMATPLSVMAAGGKVGFVDCNREDLCLSLADLRVKIARHKPAAVWVVHIGGHIAFDIEGIARLCRREGVVLLEDCAHAHGATFKGRKPGSWGRAGFYSFYGTKTISTGEGGMLVSKDRSLMGFAAKYRNYGKPDYRTPGLNLRINEFAAALGCVETDRLPDIVAWKQDYARRCLDPIYPNRVRFPAGMKSGYYKYIVFDPIAHSTGKVYDQPCHRIMGRKDRLPDSEWVAAHHWCVPLYYKGIVQRRGS